MKPVNAPLPVGTHSLDAARVSVALILGYGLFQTRDLWFAWNHSPFDALGWLAFAIWISPLFVAPPIRVSHAPIIAGGVLTILLGQIGDLNALKYLGLALLITGLQPWKPGRLLWLVAAVSWMPLFGYTISRFSPEAVPGGRIVLASVGVILFFHANRKSLQQKLIR